MSDLSARGGADSVAEDAELPLAARGIRARTGRSRTSPAGSGRGRSTSSARASALPWKRRLSKAALLVPEVRYWEKQFLPPHRRADCSRRAWSCAARPAASGTSTRCCPRRSASSASPSSGRSASGRSTCSSPPASSCTSAAWPSWPPAKARRSPPSLPGVPQRAGRQGRPRHHRQRLPGQARRRVDRPGLPDARPVGRRPPAEDGRRRTASAAYRRDITYGTASEFGFDFLRDRLKVRGGQAPGRPVLGRRGCPAPAPAKLDPRVQRDAPLRPRGRGRQHLHRRGPDAAHHRQPDPAGRRRRSRSSTTGPTASPSR